MRSLGLCIAGLIATLALVAVLIAVFNVGDERLRPDLAGLLENRPSLEPKEVEAYKFLLGLRAPSEQNPAEVGQKIYEAMRARRDDVLTLNTQARKLEPANRRDPCHLAPYCPKASVAEARSELEETLKADSALVARFEELVKTFPAVGSDIPSEAVSLPDYAGFYQAARAARLKWSFEAQSGKAQDAALALWLTNNFCLHSLAHPQSLLAGILLAQILRENRQFAIEASQENPVYRQALTPEIQKSFLLEAGFEKLANLSLDGEIRVMADSFREPEEKTLVSKLKWAMLFKRNRTLNAVDASSREALAARCVRTLDECPEDWEPTPAAKSKFGQLLNPLGEQAIAITRIKPRVFKNLFRTVKDLTVPLEERDLLPAPAAGTAQRK